MRNSDSLSSSQSNALLNYPFCIMENLSNKFLMLPDQIMFMKTCSQIRLLNEYYNRIIVKNKVYSFNNLMVCEYCNVEEQMIMHRLYECPLLDAVRRELNLSELSTTNVNSYRDLLSGIKMNIVNNVVNFLIHNVESGIADKITMYES